MKKTITILLAVLLLTAMLPFAALAEDTVTKTTDENGNPITIITDEEGNETIIRQVEPGEDDITFDEADLDLDETEGDADTPSDALIAPAPSETPEAASENGVSPLVWLIPLFVAVCAAIVLLIRRSRRQG